MSTGVIIATSGGAFGERRDSYIGGFHDTDSHYPRSTVPIDDMVLTSCGSDRATVLCLTTGSDARLKNTEVFDSALCDRFKRAGAADVQIMAVTYYWPADAEILSAIESADVVYVSGGTSHMVNETFVLRGIDDLLKEAFFNGTIMSGLSAGLGCWFSAVNTALSDDFVGVCSGLGWYDAYVAVHGDEEPVRHRPFHDYLLDHTGVVGLAFDEHTAIEIKGPSFRLHQFGPGGCVRRGHYCADSGVYSFEELDISDTWVDLADIGICCTL